MPLYLGWALDAYRFNRYRDGECQAARLLLPDGDVIERVERMAEAVWTARDLINMPPERMVPGDLAGVAVKMADDFSASCRVIEGDELLEAGYPAVHAVGRQQSSLPTDRCHMGRGGGPLVTLVGKGVCFDVGGLNLKNAAGMLRMKKDMGCAAAVLAVAHMVMGEGLGVRLRVLIPAVDNAVDGNAYRPLDVIKARKGMTIEIGDTDAEGRVILADTNTVAGWAFADHIQAALFLEGFAGTDAPWLHIETLCRSVSDRPGRPRGGDPQGSRAVFELLCRRYGGTS